ncbi:flagellar export chaperone FlgN [Moorella sulfitireducens]|uniref:flagellar export chaperone FlgN n=1 Tax=Neomoorella sulfitireducens TaxID=2972948 RepID=UPI0021ACBE1D|nr:flagellar export chaperone FlgN [Moorella sulfitireducens]
MGEAEKVAGRLFRSYCEEIELLQEWRLILKQQRQAIQGAAWDELNKLLAGDTAWKERMTGARQATRQLEELLVLVSGCEPPEWDKLDFLPAAARQELAAASRQLRHLYEECRQLQETNLKDVQEAMAAVKAQVEQVQAARQMCRTYKRENKTAVPRCLDRRL